MAPSGRNCRSSPVILRVACGLPGSQYANARGEGTIAYPTPDRINFTLNVAT